MARKTCEAYVPDKNDFGSTRFCRRAPALGDRLCRIHRRAAERVNNDRYIITINKKGVRPIEDKHGHLIYPKFVIGKCFNSLMDAQTWADMNGSLIWKIPRINSYCIEPYSRVFKNK